MFSVCGGLSFLLFSVVLMPCDSTIATEELVYEDTEILLQETGRILNAEELRYEIPLAQLG